MRLGSGFRGQDIGLGGHGFVWDVWIGLEGLDREWEVRIKRDGGGMLDGDWLGGSNKSLVLAALY